MNTLVQLADLLRRHNQITHEIAAHIGRPAERSHIGEFIAGQIFAITIKQQANHKGSDGTFSDGPLAGCSVNIKFYGANERILDVNTTSSPPDYYLVLTGPVTPAGSSRGATRPFTIAHVYLFGHTRLSAALSNVKIGIATSVRQALWEAAEIYPRTQNPLLVLTEAQRALLALFQIT